MTTLRRRTAHTRPAIRISSLLSCNVCAVSLVPFLPRMPPIHKYVVQSMPKGLVLLT